MQYKNIREMLAYISVACLAAFSDWVVFALISWGRPEWDVLLAQAPARLTGGLTAFLLHRAWSFSEQQGRGLNTEAGRFIALYIFSFCFSLSTLWVLVDVLGANRYWSKALSDTLCFVVNYVVMKLYVFNDAQNLARAAQQLRTAK
jgi:putative flippase GtrA